MHPSPSLFFDILTTEDEQSRDEKIKRASFEIKTAHVSSPPNSSKLPQRLAVAATAAAAAVPAGNAPQLGDSAADLTHQLSGDQQQQQQHQDTGPAAQQEGDVAPQLDAQQQHQQQQQQLVLSPQEVLQELLGDMYIDQSRLTMGDLLGQGGFADVHAAELADVLLPSFREAVAVKRLRPDVLQGPDDLREFLTEANLLRKLQHRNIVRLRGVGATDLTDLVSMRGSMYVVQEFMAGGDLKALVTEAMAHPFDPPYTKTHAFAWAMQIAEALHYLHIVCCPMIIHRDLKLDNVLLTGGNMHERVAKLADFGLHKRVRKLTSSGTLVAWNQETTYHGGDYEKSFYGGKLYLVKSAMSIASSVRDDDSVRGNSTHAGSMYGGSTHGGNSLQRGSLLGGGSSLHGGSSWHRGMAAGTALGVNYGVNPGVNTGVNNSASGSGCSDGVPGAAPAGGGCGSSGQAAAAAAGVAVNSKPPLPYKPNTAAQNGTGGGQQQQQLPGATAADEDGVYSHGIATLSDSAASVQGHSAAADKDKQQQQQQEHMLLQGAVRAKSEGLLTKQDFVTRVLTVPSNSTALTQGPMYQGDAEVVRTLAAVQALEGSVRAGTVFNQLQQQQQQPPPQQPPPQQQQQQRSPGVSSVGSRSQGLSRRIGVRQSELCPQLVQQLQAGGGQHSQRFIEATQKVGSVMYMAPEVLTGHHYNEKIDVFSFGIILYELLSGVILASRVAMQGEHEELLDYARKVANGHREALPTHWPAQVRNLVSACWAQDPKKRPSFKQVLRELYALKQAGVDVVMEGLRPRGDYNPVTDCGCSIM